MKIKKLHRIIVVSIMLITSSLHATECDDVKTCLPIAEKGDAIAQKNLGYYFTYGMRGVEQDIKKGVYWLTKSAEQGTANAQHVLGLIYAYGKEGISIDFTKSVYWLRKSANQGYSSARLELGLRYLNGEGLEKNEKKAFYWINKASFSGSPSAQRILGNFYANGTGVKKNSKEAFSSYLVSAGGGDSISQSITGAMYWNGKGTKKNLYQGHYWTKIAANAGENDAKNNINAMQNTKSIIITAYKMKDTIDMFTNRANCQVYFKITNNSFGTIYNIDALVDGYDDRGRKVESLLSARASNTKGFDRIKILVGDTIDNVGDATFKEECQYLSEIRFRKINEHDCSMKNLPEDFSCNNMAVLESEIPTLKIKK